MYKWYLIVYVICSVLFGTTSLILSYIIGDFIDQLSEAEDISFIVYYFTTFVTVNVISLVLGYISGRAYVKIQTLLSYAINREFIQKLQRAPLSYAQTLDTAYLNQRINNDANAVITFSISIIQGILVNTTMVIVPVFFLFYFHIRLAITLLSIAIFYFILYVSYRRVLYKASHAYQEAQSEFFSKLNEQLFNIRFIKIHSLFSNFINRLNKGFSNVLSRALEYQRASYIFSGLDQLVYIVAQMALLFFGGREIVAGRLTIGRFILIISFFNMMLGGLRYFFNLGQTIQSNLVSYNRLMELDAITPESNGSENLLNIQSIELRDVSFSYGQRNVHKRVNLTFEKGKIYVILGANGTGKSTLADIIMGLQVGNISGDLLYNRVPVENLDMYFMRGKQMGVSEQNSILLTDTLAYNLNLDKEDNIENRIGEIGKLTKILGLDEYIHALPNQLNTIINEGASNLSGGEKQKLTMLRAFLKNADVIILDEPTSALDEHSRNALKDYLQSIKEEKIIIVITHDKDLVEHNRDVVIMLDSCQSFT